MKKVIIGLSVVAILAVVVVLFTNSRISGPETKKAKTEMSKDCGKCTSTCDQAKSKDSGSEVAVATPGSGNAEMEKPCCKEAGSMKKACEETACPMKKSE
jgi:hypothetical protein